MNKVEEIFNLLAPFVVADTIVYRTRQQIATNIKEFITISKNDNIIACCGLKKHSSCYEMYAFAIHQNYQKQGYGKKLLTLVDKRVTGKLIALSKYNKSWFIANNFKSISVAQLPREISYNKVRGSNIFMKHID